MNKLMIFFFLSLFFIVNCGKNQNDYSNLNEKDLFQKAQELYQIKDFQNSIECYKTFVNKFPKNEESPNALKFIASIYANDVKDINKSIEYYKKIINDYPESKECPNAMFTIGFLYNNELKDSVQAKICYEQFIQKFPNHEAVQSAKFEIENLGKNMEDIINKLPFPETSTKTKSK